MPISSRDCFTGVSFIAFTLAAFSTALVRAEVGSPTFEQNQKVEVREGDVWSPAVISAREGRRYEIRYGDGTTEWVTADRVRRPLAGTSVETKAAPATQDRTVAPDAPKFRVKDRVEIKWGGTWREGVIKQVDQELCLVAYDGWEQQMHWEWLTPDRLRKPGSNEEGPSPLDQFSHKVRNKSVLESLKAARTALKEHRARATRRDKADGSPFAPPPLDKPVTDADRSGIRTILPEKVAWTVKPDPAAMPAPPINRPIVLTTPAGKGARRVLEPILSGGFALIRTQEGSPADPVGLDIEVLDLRAGRRIAGHEVDPASLPLAVSPSGELIAARSNGFHHGTKSRLDVWRRQGKALEHVISFVPLPEDRTTWRDIDWVGFIDESRAIIGTWSKIGCWDLASAKGIWELETRPTQSVAAFSPGQKYIAVVQGSDLIVLDTASGKIVGSLAGAAGAAQAVAFSPDGRRIGALGGEVLSVWDAEQGRPMPSVGIPPGARAESLVFLDSENVLVGPTLFHLPACAAVWSYQVEGGVADPTNGRIWALLNDRDRQVLRSWPLPDAAAKAAIAQGKPVASVLTPGTSVTLDLGGLDADEKLRQQIVKSLTDQMAKRKITIADGQKIRLVARTESGRSEERTYQTLGGAPWNREQQTVTVTEKITRFSVEVDGKVAWERRAASTASGMVQMKEGQSVQDAVEASQANSATFLQRLTLPEVILPPTEPLTAGSSKLGLSGVVRE